jgi:hypothetical protein
VARTREEEIYLIHGLILSTRLDSLAGILFDFHNRKRYTTYMKKKRDYIVLDFDSDQYYWALDLYSSTEAVEEYVREIGVKKSFTGQVVEAGKYIDFEATIQPSLIVKKISNE